MKRVAFLSILCFSLFAYNVYSQQTEQAPKLKVIEVTGSAESEVEPDEVYLSINIREYMKDRATKVFLSEIEKEFRKMLTTLKIENKDVSVENVNAYYNYDWWRNESRKTDFLASKTFVIKLPSLDKYNEMMKMMDMKGIENAWLQKTDYSKMEELKQQLRIKALKTAQAKAKYMLESIGSNIGEVIFIREINAGNYYQPPMYKAMSNASMDAENAQAGAESFGMQKIKVRFEVEAHFSIK